jgi:hypothetical protein
VPVRLRGRRSREERGVGWRALEPPLPPYQKMPFRLEDRFILFISSLHRVFVARISARCFFFLPHPSPPCRPALSNTIIYFDKTLFYLKRYRYY